MSLHDATHLVAGACSGSLAGSGHGRRAPRESMTTALTKPSTGPQRIAGRYRVEAALGEGGMGVVSRAHDESTGRTVAVKQLHPAEGRAGTALFQREYHTLVLLKHPRIVEVYDYGIDAAGPYYTMELLDGD